MVFFFFFKQKTAYEIGTGDWSSDVCSSDLTMDTMLHHVVTNSFHVGPIPSESNLLPIGHVNERSEERRVGKECRSRWSPYH